MDLFENGLKEDEIVGARVIELLEKYKDKPFFSSSILPKSITPVISTERIPKNITML
jgi:hypothetical protein